jgi:hypothetical protein
MTIHEARFLGGPAEGDIRQLDGVKTEIKVAHMPPQPSGWRDRGPGIREVAVETHIYRPSRTVTYYTHEGKR